MFLLSFLVRRLSQGVLIIVLVTLLIFTLLRVVPGDPVRLMAGGMAHWLLLGSSTCKQHFCHPTLAVS